MTRPHSAKFKVIVSESTQDISLTHGNTGHSTTQSVFGGLTRELRCGEGTALHLIVAPQISTWDKTAENYTQAHGHTRTRAHAHRRVEAAETEQGPQPGQRYRPDVTEDATTRRGRVEGTRDLVY